MVHTGGNSGEVRHDACRHPFTGLPEQYPIQERTRTNLLLQTTFRPIEVIRTGNKAEYYTVNEAMEKFNLSRDSVYGILQFHQINREKNGRFVRFLKVEFDRVTGVRK